MEPPHTQGAPLWLTAYLFFEGHVYGEAADRVIREVVAPLVEACRPDAVCWFFLRYAKEGNHVRLRFFAPGPVLEERIWPRVAKAAASSELVVRSTRERYEPEVERYGGPWGLALAEELFHRQSETALALLEKIEPGNRSKRLGKGLLAMLVLLFLYRGERRAAAELARRYGTGYLKAWAVDAEQQEHWLRTFQEAFDRQADRLAGYVESAWEALESGGELTPELDTYRRDMGDVVLRLRELFDEGRLLLGTRTAADWDECVRWIVPSYIHMMNNRLGVSIQEESYLSVLIAGTLGEGPKPGDQLHGD
ncbi:MAG TPA: thiopeptide-type bacteriocin biosynthesis protein [Thermoanaerobaculia bacterium]|nr:thiopeptide-type bacteriocin biosynthesis protein [Thermoanaerobaculia bacterium]